ncbi:MAG TPA: alpha/beta fold hydrolase [Solirubrobacteraceae bacterium]|nr:alpha/beta fold hydrolase [Solirubrobacteraceae bacterium]
MNAIGATAATAFYLPSGAESVFALFEPPQGGEQRSAVGVLICPQFGNDDLCSYRARLEWARALAAAGHATVRFDLPGTGDSIGGPYDPGRVQAWVGAVATAAAWLREQPGCAHVCAIGIGLGGLLATCAAAEGAAIDDLVLWAVPARGRVFVRQLRVLSQMEASRATAVEPESAALPEGAIASAGFMLSAETVAALEAIDLTKLQLPDAPRRRVLLLERDGLDVDARLREALSGAGAEVEVAPGPGYGAMVIPPQQSRPPTEVFATVGAWLAQSPPEPASAAPERPARRGATTALELTVDGARVRETPIAISRGEGRLLGVLAEGESPAPLCAVLLNAGALRRIGPNRMWVETARRWAACGVSTLRVDLAGIGDSDGDAGSLERDEGLYVPRYVGQTIEVLDALGERGLPQRFVLAGLCSGAYWSFQAALEDDRVAAAYMINPRALFWDWDVGAVRDARNVRKALLPATWGKLLRGQITRERVATISRGVGVSLGSLPARARTLRAGHEGAGGRLADALELLERNGTDLVGLFTAGEPLYAELMRDGGLGRMRARANVRIESIPGPLTSHTLEPLPLQRAIASLLDEALQRTLRHSSPEAEITQPGLSARAG